MKSESQSAATMVGVTAQMAMGTAGFEGRVIAAVSNAVYMQSASGELLWMTTPGNVIHARAVIAPCHLRGLPPDVTITLDHGWLTVGSSFSVEVAHAPVWVPPLVGPESATDARMAASSFMTLLKAITPIAPSSGFAPAIAYVSSTATFAATPADVELFAGSESVRGVIDSVSNRQSDTLQKAAGLLGLGPGLTPSGDDFAGGLVFALRALHVAYPDRFPWDDSSARDMVARAREQTNGISAELLHDHIKGRGAGPLHDLAYAVLTAQPEERLMPAAEGLMRIGRTTGWDILTGFCAGMLLLCHESRS